MMLALFLALILIYFMVATIVHEVHPDEITIGSLSFSAWITQDSRRSIVMSFLWPVLVVYYLLPYGNGLERALGRLLEKLGAF